MNHYNTTYVATRDDVNQNIVASCNNVANRPVGSKLKVGMPCQDNLYIY